MKLKKVLIIVALIGSPFLHSMEKVKKLTVYDELDSLLIGDSGSVIKNESSDKNSYVALWLKQKNVVDGITLNNIISNEYLDPFIRKNNEQELTRILMSKYGDYECVSPIDHQKVMSKYRQATSNLEAVTEFLDVATNYNNNTIYKLSDDLGEVNQTLQLYYPNYSSSKEGYSKKFFTNTWHDKQQYPLQVAVYSNSTTTPVVTSLYNIHLIIQKERRGFSLLETIMGGGLGYSLGGASALLPITIISGLYTAQEYLKYRYYYGALDDSIASIQKNITAINLAINNVRAAQQALELYKNDNEIHDNQ